MRAIWADRGLDKVAPLSDIEMDMATFAAEGPKLRGVLGLRGMGKTTLMTCTISVFRLLRDPNRQILISSKSTAEARKTVKLIRAWIREIWFLQHMIPRKDQEDNANYFNIGTRTDTGSRQPSVSCFGIEGALEGNRAHTIIADDIENKSNTKTREAREELRRLAGEYKNILYPHRDHADGGPLDPVEIVYVGTPKHEESLYQNRIDAGYSFRSYPIACPSPNEEVIALAPIIKDRISRGIIQPGQPLLPLRFGLQEIAERMAEGYSEFARESMLIANLSATNRYPIRLSDLIIHDIDPKKAPIYIGWAQADHNGSTALDIASMGFGDDCLRRPAMIDQIWQPYTHTAAWIDPAGRGTDHTGIAIVAYLNGFYWVKHLSSIPGGGAETDMTAICELCRLHGANTVYVESNADTFGTYREIFRVLLQRHFLPPNVDPAFPDGWKASFVDDTKITHQTGQKELRILADIEPVISNHRMIIAPSTIATDIARKSQDELQYQLSRLTREPKCLKEDAMIDALAGCIHALKHILAGDPIKNRQRIEDQLILNEVKESSRLLKQLESHTTPRWMNRR